MSAFIPVSPIATTSTTLSTTKSTGCSATHPGHHRCWTSSTAATAKSPPPLSKKSSFIPSYCSCTTSFPPTLPYQGTTTTISTTSPNAPNTELPAVSPVSVVSCQLTTERLANKPYQLEEDEDDTSCTTALYFNADGSLSLGRTDGPQPDRVNANWSFDSGSGQLMLDIERYFEGEAGIEFMVKRILRGHLDVTRKENLQDLPVFTGAMYPYPTDFSKHSEVGFFAMILATDDLPRDDFDISRDN